MKKYDRDGWFKELEAIFDSDDFEPQVKQCFKEVVSTMPGAVFADVGANVGFYTKLFATLKGEVAEVFAFEPDPVVFKRLKENANNLRQVFGSTITTIEVAISSECGSGTLYTSDELADGIYGRLSAGMDERFISVCSRNSKLIPVTVKTDTIDNYFYDKGVRVDLIKLDVESEEIRAIHGAILTLLTYHPTVIIESHNKLHPEVCSLMEKLGFTSDRLNDGRFSCWEWRGG